MDFFPLKVTIGLIFFFVKISEGTLLSDDEKDILPKFVNRFNVQNIVLLTDDFVQFSPSPNEISVFKKSFDMKTYVLSLLNSDVRKIVFNEAYARTKTMIVLKSDESVSFMVNHTHDLQSANELYRMSPFIWLMFITGAKNYSLTDFNFLIPYDCEFFIIRPFEFKTYKITKVHTLGTEGVFRDYGIYGNNIYNISEMSKYPNRVDMNQTDFKSVECYCPEDRAKFYKSYNLTDVACFKENLFKDIIKSMNFRYIEINYNADNLDEIAKSMDAFNLMFIIDSDNVVKNFIKHWPKLLLELYIKVPEADKTDDFYNRPFSVNLWIAIISTVIFAGFFCVAMNCIKNSIRKRRILQNVIDHFLIPYEYLINQGEEYDVTLSFRICALAFRFLGIFIFLSYSSEIWAYLSTSTIKLPFKSLEGLVENGKYKLIMGNFSEQAKYFQRKFPEIMEKSNLIEILKDINVLLPKICSNEKFAMPLHHDHVIARILHCKLFLIPKPIGYQAAGMNLGDNNHYSALINHIFLKARESGIVMRIVNSMSSFIKERFLYKKEAVYFETVEIKQLSHLFSILGFGILAGLTFLISEFLLK